MRGQDSYFLAKMHGKTAKIITTALLMITQREKDIKFNAFSK